MGIKITISWYDLNDPTTDADIGEYNVAANAWEITLNSGALANASRDYIAATLLHEFMQIVLPGNNAQDHEEMANNWIPELTTSLLHAGFLMMPQELEALSWGGLCDTTAWQQKMQQDINNGRGSTQEIKDTNLNYKRGEQGPFYN